MCLIVVAHRVSESYPLVIAANRDEDYERPTRPAHWWDDAPDVLGGRDLLHGGSWLALSRRGRVAAVTNVRGAIRSNENRSRGELVSGFVRGTDSPRGYVEHVERRKEQYAGFHLLAGEIGGELVLLSEAASLLEPGVHGVSNAPAGVYWPKVEATMESMRGALQADGSEQMAQQLLRVLHLSATHRDPTRDIFVTGQRYGTRSSTVIIAGPENILFVEQNYGRRGLPEGPPVQVSLVLQN
ncbi:MAG: NRDE family protein [Thermoanaerobaculia bacterium]